MLSLFHFLLSSPFSLRYPVSIRLVLIDFLDTSLFTLFNIPNIVLSLTHMPKPSSCVIFSSSCAYSILCCLFFKDYSLMNFVFLQSQYLTVVLLMHAIFIIIQCCIPYDIIHSFIHSFVFAFSLYNQRKQQGCDVVYFATFPALSIQLFLSCCCHFHILMISSYNFAQ